MSEQRYDLTINGGPAMPLRFCAKCGTLLKGAREHCMDKKHPDGKENLFCNQTCRKAYAAEQSASS